MKFESKVLGLLYLTIAGVFLGPASGLNCYVGIGNTTDKLLSAYDDHQEIDPLEDPPAFQEKECGTPGSQLVNIEVIMQNITDKIKESWGKVAERAGQLAGSLTSSRRKRFAIFERYRRETGNDTAEQESASAEPEGDAEAESTSEEENYACVKAMAAGMIFRSCVPKYGVIRLNCTSAFEQNVLCYCHTDGCNGSNQLAISISSMLSILILTILNVV